MSGAFRRGGPSGPYNERGGGAESPIVSVLLPVRNGFPWLQSALESVLAQTLTAIEIIVLEDGSTDETVAYLASIDDPRVRVISTGGIGIAGALNLGIDVARGHYIARQDADDESAPHRFSQQVALLDANEDVDLLATVADYIDAQGRSVSSAWVDTIRRQQDAAVTPEDIRALMPLTCCVTHGSMMVRGDILRRNRYDPTMVPAEDYDLWLRLLPEHRFAKLPERLYRHRLHEAQSGARRRDDQTRMSVLAKLRYVRRVCPDLPAMATLAIVGATRGDDVYREIAPAVGFQVTDGGDAWDVLAVTDFATIDAHDRQLSSRSLTRIGNCFVSRQRGGMRRTA